MGESAPYDGSDKSSDREQSLSLTPPPPGQPRRVSPRDVIMIEDDLDST